MSLKWYILHTLTGQEDKVKAHIEKQFEEKNILDCIGEIFIPKEKISEVKNGKKKITERMFFPGYLLINMELNKNTWYLMKEIPGVTGFLGYSEGPVPISEEKVKQILHKTEEKTEKPTPKVEFEIGEAIRVKDGPFTNFNGTIEEIDPGRGKLKASVTIFGRSTPVDLEYWQVEKI
jgi:transcriptional antiterminator NusG